MGTLNVNLVVRADITATGSITNSDYAVRSDQVAQVRGAEVITQLKKLPLLELDKIASTPMVVPGDLITYTLTVTNIHGLIPTTNVVLTDTIPLGTTFVSASSPYTQTGDVIQWDYPSLDAMGTLMVELAVRVDGSTTGTLTNADYVVRADQAIPVHGAPVTTLVGKVFFLPLMVRSP
jgi:uncharacterized repeat protein (TIGR01451 family)